MRPADQRVDEGQSPWRNHLRLTAAPVQSNDVAQPLQGSGGRSALKLRPRSDTRARLLFSAQPRCTRSGRHLRPRLRTSMGMPHWFPGCGIKWAQSPRACVLFCGRYLPTAETCPNHQRSACAPSSLLCHPGVAAHLVWHFNCHGTRHWIAARGHTPLSRAGLSHQLATADNYFKFKTIVGLTVGRAVSQDDCFLNGRTQCARAAARRTSASQPVGRRRPRIGF